MEAITSFKTAFLEVVNPFRRRQRGVERHRSHSVVEVQHQRQRRRQHPDHALQNYAPPIKSEISSASDPISRTDEWLDVTVGVLSPPNVNGTDTTKGTAFTKRVRAGRVSKTSRRQPSHSPFRYTRTHNRSARNQADGVGSTPAPHDPRLSPSDIFVGVGDSLLSPTPSPTPSDHSLPPLVASDHGPRSPSPASTVSSALTDPTLQSKQPQQFDMEYERRLREDDLQQLLREGTYSAAEIRLFRHLTMRAFEPLLPHHWAMDFKTLPNVLFTRDDSQTVLNSISGQDFRAQRALSGLMGLGARVRARYLAGVGEDGAFAEGEQHTTEELLKREVERFIKWSEDDGGFSAGRRDGTVLPLIAISSPTAAIKRLPRREKLKALERLMRRRLGNLARRHRENLAVADYDPSLPNGRASEQERARGRARARESTVHASTEDRAPTPRRSSSPPPPPAGDGTFRPPGPPTLYGMVVTGAQLAFVTYDAAKHLDPPSPPLFVESPGTVTTNGDEPGTSILAPSDAGHDETEGAEMRSMGLCNFHKEGQDVWNAFSVAIVVICARDEMARRLKVEQDSGFGLDGGVGKGMRGGGRGQGESEAPGWFRRRRETVQLDDEVDVDA